MKIIIDDINIDNIDINPFTFANIYEKQRKNDISYIKYFNQTITYEKIEDKQVLYFNYYTNNINTGYILVELIPNINLEKILIKYEITSCDYSLNNGESLIINTMIGNIPYYFHMNSKPYQQFNLNLIMNHFDKIPFESLEVYELTERYNFDHNKYTNNTIQLINNNNNKNDISSFSFNYMINSFFTNFIIIKITPKFNVEYLYIKMDIGGGYYDLEKGLLKNITNIYSKYSYYFFVLSSKDEKLNFNISINSNQIKQPFNSINIYEYSNKHLPYIYNKNINEEFKTEIKESKSIIYISYITKNNSTNFVVFEIIPNYNFSFIECLVETEKEEKNNSSLTLLTILTIILIVIIFFTTIIFIIYLKKSCKKSSYNLIEEFNKDINNINDKSKEKKFELALLPIDLNSTSN